MQTDKGEGEEKVQRKEGELDNPMIAIPIVHQVCLRCSNQPMFGIRTLTRFFRTQLLSR